MSEVNVTTKVGGYSGVSENVARLYIYAGPLAMGADVGTMTAAETVSAERPYG